MATNILVESPRASGRAEIALNSTVVTSGDFVSLSGGSVTTAATATGKVIGVSNQTKTYSATNQTVAKETLSYTVATDTLLVRCAIVNGTITNSDEGKFFLLFTANTVDSLSKTATEAGTQLRLVKFISATLGEFAIV